MLFGGVNVVLFGDLLQLPPVKAPPIYVPLNGYQVPLELIIKINIALPDNKGIRVFSPGD